jgi:hypothetical protein
MLKFDTILITMKAKLLFLFLLAVVFGACKKDKYETKPKLKLKEILPADKTIAQGDVFSMDFEVFDKEGDVKDSIFMLRFHIGTPSCGAPPDTTNITIPDYPSSPNSKVLFRVQYEYNSNNRGLPLLGAISCTPPRNDTAFFKIWVKDKGGNFSDTLTTEPLVFLR